MRDVRDFIAKAKEIYGYPHFINDAGGSLCELDEPGVLEQLAEDTLIVYLKPSEAMLERIIERSLADPKPMYYQSEFLDRVLPQYLLTAGSRVPKKSFPMIFSDGFSPVWSITACRAMRLSPKNMALCYPQTALMIFTARRNLSNGSVRL